jgi:hypothetical protein
MWVISHHFVLTKHLQVNAAMTEPWLDICHLRLSGDGQVHPEPAHVESVQNKFYMFGDFCDPEPNM